MRIAVYTIALNEEQFVERWAESCKDADYRLILDTGSTDKTLHEIILNDTIHWEQKEFTPWRFDEARNYALSRLPDDIDLCISLDMDEVLIDGWREHLEAVASNVTRPRYKYVWSWNADGSEGLTYGGDKIHKRHGYTWKHPVHEVIKPIGNGEVQEWCGLEIHHHPDSSKSRGQYFDLLKLAVEEEPNDDRNQFYLGREYFFHGDYANAFIHFKSHLELSVWGPERAASCRYLSRCEPDLRLHWLYRAVAEDHNRRENWFALMQYYYDIKDYSKLRDITNMALTITVKPLDYLCEADAWGWQFDDLAALGFHYTGDSNKAKLYGYLACAANPTDKRLKSNAEFY